MIRPPTVRLDAITEVRLGRQRSPKNHVGDQMRPYLRAANVGWSGLLLDDVKQMNFTDAEMRTYALAPNDLLLNEASGSAREVGKPALWNGEIENCAFQNTLLRVRPGDRVAPRYLLHYFKQQAATGALAAGSRGVGIFHLGREALAAWPVPLPPFPDQRRIAAILDLAEGLQSKRRASLALLGSLAESIFLEMFGDPAPGCAAWPTSPLGDLLSMIDSGKSPVCLDRPPTAEEWGVLKLSAVTSGEFVEGAAKALPPGTDPDPRHEVRPGDVLFTRKNTYALVAATAFVHSTRPRLLLSDLVFRLRLRPEVQVLPEYLQRVLAMPSLRREVQKLAGGSAGSMPNVSKSRLLEFAIPIPPLDLQVTFGERVTAARQAHEIGVHGQAELDALFTSLQHRAFTGQL